MSSAGLMHQVIKVTEGSGHAPGLEGDDRVMAVILDNKMFQFLE